MERQMPRLDDVRHRTPPPAHDTMGTAAAGTLVAGIVMAFGFLVLVGKLAERDQRLIAAEAAQQQADRTYTANIVIPRDACPPGRGVGDVVAIIINRDAHGHPVEHHCLLVDGRGAGKGWRGTDRRAM